MTARRASSAPTLPVVRTATLADALVLAAFNITMARETEQRELSSRTVERGVRAVLLDPNKGTFLIAERASEVVGALLVTTEWSDWRNAWFWWIQSVFVVPEHRREGVFRTLHREVVARARRDPEVCGVRLYVHDENIRALRTYEKLGMQRTEYVLMEVETPPEGRASEARPTASSSAE